MPRKPSYIEGTEQGALLGGPVGITPGGGDARRHLVGHRVDRLYSYVWIESTCGPLPLSAVRRRDEGNAAFRLRQGGGSPLVANMGTGAPGMAACADFQEARGTTCRHAQPLPCPAPSARSLARLRGPCDSGCYFRSYQSIFLVCRGCPARTVGRKARSNGIFSHLSAQLRAGRVWRIATSSLHYRELYGPGRPQRTQKFGACTCFIMYASLMRLLLHPWHPACVQRSHSSS